MLLPAITVTLLSDLLLTAVFAALARSERQRYLHWFAWAWGLGAMRLVVSLLVATGALPAGPGNVLVDTSVALLTGFMVLGVASFLGRRLSPRWAWALVPLLAYSAAAEALGWPFWLARVPTFTVLGLASVTAGVVLARAKALPRTGRLGLGITLVLWGVHRVDYPFLRQVEWFAPWGFGLATVFELMLAVSVLVLHFELAKQRTREADARYRSLLETTTQGIYAGDGTRFTAVNPALVKMLGYATEAEVLGLTIPDDLYVDPAQRARLQQEGDVVHGRELDWKRKDGQPLTVSLWGRVVRDAAGTFAGYEGFVTDITKMKALQANLQQSQKMEALGRVAGGVAHDFNNLLTIINTAVFMARRHLPTEGVEYLDAVDDAAQRATGLTRQLLAFSRRGPALRRSADLAQEVTEAAPMLRRLVAPGHRLDVEVAVPSLGVGLDKDQVGQVLLNLVVNARDAMPGGGAIALRVSRAGAEAVLTVRDTGVGMSEDTQRQVFEPFFTTKPFGSGTGLGLSTLYGHVTQAGGTVLVDSALGRGTTFTLRLPVRTPTAPELPAATPLPGAVTPQRTVLLVDDDEMVLRSTSRILEEAGFRVQRFNSGKEAVAWARGDNAYDALVSDINMPGMNGLEVAEALKPKPTVLISGDLGPAASDGGLLPEGVAFVQKPFRAEALVQSVKRQLSAAASAPTA